jgi:tRNA/tmRNA/rRNA uracil-C5-methylase (TrmA/RlmC/RlmD family)
MFSTQIDFDLISVNSVGAEVLYSQVADWCNVSPATTVLDICCGTKKIFEISENKEA